MDNRTHPLYKIVGKYIKIAKFVEDKYSECGSSHGIEHIYNVVKNVIIICQAEKIKQNVPIVAALFHDVVQLKDNSGDDVRSSAKIAEKYLLENGYNQDFVDEVCQVIIEASWENHIQNSPPKTISGYVLRDSDWLESIGLHGIARTFSYSGEKKVYFGFPPFEWIDPSTYSHINDKLLKMKDLFYFDISKKEAKKRHQSLIAYIEQYQEETDWNHFH